MQPKHLAGRGDDGNASRPAPTPSLSSAERHPRSAVLLCVWAVLAAVVFVGLLALGTWQVQRRAWKLDLIERVTQRVHAPPVAAPGPAQWPQVSKLNDEYRHVQVSGTLLNQQETLVQANTDMGSGFWVITPLRTADGTTVLINRGFVPPGKRDPATRDPGPTASTEEAQPVAITGLLRMTEPGGGYLRRNDPGAGHWYSRDVQAIAGAHGLSHVAPYFIDADKAAGSQETWPVGGLTVVSFPNSHLVYAITWYVLAVMVAAAAWYVAREEKRLRRRRSHDNAGHAKP